MMCGPRDEVDSEETESDMRELRIQSLILRRHGEEFQEKREFRERNHVQHTFS